MKRFDARLVHLSVLSVAATGVVYGGLHYFGSSEDDFGIMAHPWVPALQAMHVLVAPLFLFSLGMIWNYHIVAKLRSRQTDRRRSGIMLVSQAIPMVVSGYALQISVDVIWRTVWIWAHVITSSLFMFLFVAHLLVRLKHDQESGTGGRVSTAG